MKNLLFPLLFSNGSLSYGKSTRIKNDYLSQNWLVLLSKLLQARAKKALKNNTPYLHNTMNATGIVFKQKFYLKPVFVHTLYFKKFNLVPSC